MFMLNAPAAHTDNRKSQVNVQTKCVAEMFIVFILIAASKYFHHFSQYLSVFWGLRGLKCNNEAESLLNQTKMNQSALSITNKIVATSIHKYYTYRKCRQYKCKPLD